MHILIYQFYFRTNIKYHCIIIYIYMNFIKCIKLHFSIKT